MYTLLVVDDENIVRRGICMLLDFNALGIGTHLEAKDGEEALRLMAENQVDLVLADINMPKMDGLEFARRAKTLDPGIMIALMTGYDYLDYAIAAIKIGVDDYVLKPISKEDVRKLLVRLMEKKQAEMQRAQVRSAVEKLTTQAGVGAERTLKNQLEDAIRAHSRETDFSLNGLAILLGYSVSYLSAQFKKQFGENFRDYLLSIRLEQAKILLLSSNLKNYEIAAAVGIEDANYFSVCFRRKYHMTTTEYRMGVQNGKET